jgi:aminopeptidase N
MSTSPPHRRARLGVLLVVAAAACSGSNDLTIAPTHAGATEAEVPIPPPLDDGRLPSLAKPTRYTLAFDIDPKEARFTGHAVISAEVAQPTQVLVLHARELSITEASVVEAGTELPAKSLVRPSAPGIGAPDELVLTLARPVVGSVQIDLRFGAAFSPELAGAYRIESGGESYVFTQFEPMDARRAFPCFDEPGFKVPFDISITTPAQNLAVANSVELSRAPSADGRKITYRFASTKPLPTYLVAFAVGPLEVREGKGTKIPLRVVTTKGKSALGEAALEAARAHVDILEKYFDHPYPYDKLDLVAVPDFAAGAMENAGFITFREELILLDPKKASASSERNMALTVAHELSHHWFGDLVTMGWWDDLWLNEGFATWMENKVVDAWRPDMGSGTSALAWRAEAMQLDTRSSARPVRRPVASVSDAEEAFDGIVYDKGAAVLAMLESWLGPEKFQAGVRQYLRAHAHGSASSSDLFQALSEASGKDVPSVASTFLDQPGVPLVTAALACDKDKPPTIELGQRRMLRKLPDAPPDKGPELRWRVPVCVGYEGDKGTPACTLLDGASAKIELARGAKCPKWIAPNAGQRGYYRYAIAKDGFRALARQADALDAVTRFGLLGDAHALVESGDLGVDVLFDVVAAVTPKRGKKLDVGERLVVEEEVATLLALSESVVDEPARKPFAAFAAKLLLPIAKDLGFEPAKGESEDAKLLRKTLLDGLGRLVDDPWILREADKATRAFLADFGSVDVDTASVALKISSRNASAARFDELRAALARADNPQVRVALLGGLGSFRDPTLSSRALDSILSPDFKKQDGRYLVRAAAATPEGRRAVLAWARAHEADIKEKLPAFVRVGFVELLEVCDPATLAEARSIFDGKLGDAEGGERALSQLYERAALCIDLANRERSRAHARLGVKP